MRDGRPVVAVLNAPAREESFTAIAGEGAWSGASRLSVSAASDLAGARLAGPRGWLKTDAIAARSARRLQPHVPSLAYRFAMVAAGRLDAAFASPRANDWDLAACGPFGARSGRSADRAGRGGAPRYNREVPRHGALAAANAVLHPALLATVAAAEQEVARSAAGASSRETGMTEPNRMPGDQLLHLVFGGELESLAGMRFRDLDQLDIVGIYPNYAEAYRAWKEKAQMRWTTRRCAISSSICTGCSNLKQAMARPDLIPGGKPEVSPPDVSTAEEQPPRAIFLRVLREFVLPHWHNLAVAVGGRDGDGGDRRRAALPPAEGRRRYFRGEGYDASLDHPRGF